MSETLNIQELDRHVLANCQARWQKVAMVIAKTSESACLGEHAGELDAIIASRIEALVAAGRLEAAGDLKIWRFSEVRLAARS